MLTLQELSAAQSLIEARLSEDRRLLRAVNEAIRLYNPAINSLITAAKDVITFYQGGDPNLADSLNRLQKAIIEAESGSCSAEF